jgi:hypothetical protein
MPPVNDHLDTATVYACCLDDPSVDSSSRDEKLRQTRFSPSSPPRLLPSPSLLHVLHDTSTRHRDTPFPSLPAALPCGSHRPDPHATLLTLLPVLPLHPPPFIP